MASSPTTPESTSSRCITEHVTATFNFEMTNYLQLKGMGVGKFVSSPVFRVGGYDWDIKFYPDGLNHGEHVSSAACFLRYHSQANDACARFSLSMLETKSQTEVASFDMTDRDFSPRSDEWGDKSFVRRSTLKSMSQVGDGCFTIRCVLTVRNESPPLELPGHLERMLGDGRGADVTFCVGGQKFGANRSLLAARSPIFMAQLFGPMAEKDMRHVEVIDMEPTIFQMMLRYIYTDSLLPGTDDGEGDYIAAMQHLLVAADRYGLDRLKHMCEEELSKQIDAGTVTSMLALANQHQRERLKKACEAFMASTEAMEVDDGLKEETSRHVHHH